jgi:alpha-galactosidase
MRKILVFVWVLMAAVVSAQEVYKVDGESLVLDNGFVRREVRIAQGSISSVSLAALPGGENCISRSREFSLLVNDVPVDGAEGWEMLSTRAASAEHSGKGVTVILKRRKNPALQVEVNYLLYPGMPVIRKWINFTNAGTTDLKLEGVTVENMQSAFSSTTSVVYHNYGRMKQLGTFVGNWDDPVIAIHDITHRRGMAVGNESPGVIKRTAYNTSANNIEAGLTLPGGSFPFRKWLKPGESWESPKVFVCPYAGSDNGFEAINNQVGEFLVRTMSSRIYQLKDKPTFVYNTWVPFRTFINDGMIREVARAAADCGIQEFIIDDGWQVNEGGVTSALGWGNNYGDWKVDEKKFPGGLKPTFDYIRSLGMKPGLWISIGSATRDSKVFREHPEWFVKNRKGQPGNLHEVVEKSDFYTSCFGTDWFGYIKKAILALANDHGLAYAKLDFSVVTSAYVTDPTISGCYATDHPYHRDHEESYIVIYQRILKLFDELHREAPGLFLDCTFETAGKLQFMDYAFALHADGNWFSNFEEPSPLGPLRIRQMAWWRTPAVPASSLVIGNLAMDDPGFEFGLKSLVGTLPIVLGDPRKLSAERKSSIRKWSKWMQQMQARYNYMNFRKDLPGFGEPAEGAWDGWMRINFQDHSGGIFGVFRQGALESSRTLFLRDLDPAANYVVRLAPDGGEVMRATGRQLMEDGFRVSIDKKYDANVFEVSRVK